MTEAYRTKDGFIRRNIADCEVIIPIGGNVANFNGFIELNSTAAFIWDKLSHGITKELLCSEMCSCFGIEADEAKADIDDFFGILLENKMIEEVK